MQEWLAYLPADRDGQMQVGYIGFCLILLFSIYWAPNRAREDELRDPVATRRWQMEEEAAKRRRPGLRVPRIFGHLEGPGVGAVMHFMIIVGMLTSALIGWRIPAEIERIYGDGAGFGLFFPNVTMPTIGKLAQVIGALTFALVALRLLRLIVPLMTYVVTIGLLWLSVEYVFEVDVATEVRTAVESASQAASEARTVDASADQ